MSSSVLLDKLIDSLQVMPGIGPVSASRIAYYLLDRKRGEGLQMAEVIEQALSNISRCPKCQNYSDTENEPCEICRSFRRSESGLLCVVEYPSDVQAIESSGSYNGTYFVLHGHLSPIEGIGPKELGLDRLSSRLDADEIKEIILAVGQTVEGDATASYIAAMAKRHNIKATRIASGVPLGGDLESVSQSTLAMSLNYRREL